jgi:pSer/pThr/pTyr-binding forkhead associated (FHA) protein
LGTISKYHAKISWDPIDSSYKISNFSKNKITVNNEALLNTDAPRTLKNLTTIQISKVKIIFLLPNDNSEYRFEVSKEMLEKYLPEKVEEYNVMKEGVK